MVRWHHRLDGLEFEQALGVGDGQGSLGCCSPWGHKESYTTEQLNNHSCFTLLLPVSVVLQRESAIRISMFPLGFPSYFTSALSRAACAIQSVLISYQFYT